MNPGASWLELVESIRVADEATLDTIVSWVREHIPVLLDSVIDMVGSPTGRLWVPEE